MIVSFFSSRCDAKNIQMDEYDQISLFEFTAELSLVVSCKKLGNKVLKK